MRLIIKERFWVVHINISSYCHISVSSMNYLQVFHSKVGWWFFHWSLRDTTLHLVSRTFHCILNDLSNIVVWMLSVGLPISKYSGFLTKSLKTVPSAKFTIKIAVIFIFHNVFILWLGPNTCFSFHFLWNSLSSAGTTWAAVMHVLFNFYFFNIYFFVRYHKISLGLFSS